MTSSVNWFAKEDLLQMCAAERIRFLRLQFTDVNGVNKNVEVPERQFEKALDGKIMFDGSSIAGFVRIEESDMLLKPDLKTFLIFPWEDQRGRVARVICDIANPDGSPFDGCPRTALKKMTARISEMGCVAMLGPEAEFFLFQRNPDGSPSTTTHDRGAYFDLAPIDKGEDCRRAIVNSLEQMGFEVEAAHHECGAGQHEIDFKYDEAVATADKIATFKFVVRKVALDFGLHATFMPKPLKGIAGSGMHTHISLFKNGANVFDDPASEDGLSEMAHHFIGGLLRHARAMCAITNPTVNSYKRLVPEFEAPTNIVWSLRNRSPLLRIPDQRGNGSRVEVRNPDPSCNPYLAFATMLAAGLDGVAGRIDPGPAINKNIFAMSQREKARLKIEELPVDLMDAVNCLRRDPVVRQALGNHLYDAIVESRTHEWADYISTVHQWELDHYLVRH
ncbi:MAG TPA: glutamine synthetase family protein [Myxococcota bacterium]|nr:glutamine synthetase family protein [Myxococcota bacterium]HOA12625.1 glutamine synthetase family protein [Myxococcota bacterium]HOH76209.1 glutamine synthetase family protein [Myxococcota bacterium]HPV05274.1 glutamine synthetase family protein [Myxococcota bacterium]